MLSLPILTVFAGLLAWGFFQPASAGWTFVTLAAAFAFWQILASWALRPRTLVPGTPPYFLSLEEIAIFRKHALYFRHPFSARQYSSAFSGIQAMCWVWVPLLLWNRQWVVAGVFVGVFFAASNLAPYLNPGYFLRHHQARGNLPDFLQEKLELVETVEKKLSENRRSA